MLRGRKLLLLLSNPQFRPLWASGAVGLVGSLVFMMIQGWLILTVTDSPFWVGAVSGMSGAGLLGFSLWGGVLADRFERRGLIVASELAAAAVAGLLAMSIFSGGVELWHILVAAFLTGAVWAIRLPSFMALTIDVVGRSRLLSANAANLASYGAAGILAPLLGGAVVANWSIGWAYVVVAAIHLMAASVILTLLDPSLLSRVAVVTGAAEASAGSSWHSLKQGISYVLTTPAVRTLVLMGLVAEAFGWAHISMLPVMARDVLGTGAAGLGYMLSGGHVGLLCSTLAVGSLGDIRRKGRLALLGYVGFGLLLVLFSGSRYLPLSVVLLASAYAVAAVYEVTLQTMVQTAVSDEMRGRVISFQVLTWGVTGLSGFHMGAIASRLGVPATIAMGGAVVVLNAIRLAPFLARLGAQPPADSLRS